MAYVLARDGQPPFVLSRENAAHYVGISASIRDIPKGSPAMRFRLAAATSASPRSSPSTPTRATSSGKSFRSTSAGSRHVTREGRP